MIFVALGTQKFQFNRLLQMIDRLLDEGKIKETVLHKSGILIMNLKIINTLHFWIKMNLKNRSENVMC